jgi:hypothetical protein
MSDHETALKPYAGTVERPKPLLERHVAMWNAVVTITELDLPGLGKRFEVRATRYGGPKLEGTPDPIGVRIGQVDDVIAERNGDRAREIALRAVEELRAGRATTLQRISQQVPGGPATAADH